MSKSFSRNGRHHHHIPTFIHTLTLFHIFILVHILILYLRTHLNHEPGLTSVNPATSPSGHPRKARN